MRRNRMQVLRSATRCMKSAGSLGGAGGSVLASWWRAWKAAQELVIGKPTTA